ncbi:MAG: hypothetical protein BMS9Abin26_0644 [Gammaproteobacteria bacterium]|nr:MAG: hypothetical protein BMS9Abin26_0644 [Gammaproteobacteria bacterium]
MMPTETRDKEQRILRMVKRVLTDIAKDTHVTVGMKHPLNDNTIEGIRECLALISSREAEIHEEQGRQHRNRPKFTDEPRSSVVVQIDGGKKEK